MIKGTNGTNGLVPNYGHDIYCIMLDMPYIMHDMTHIMLDMTSIMLDMRYIVQRECISIHVGQAGCQMGNACWELYCLEHGECRK